MEHYLRYKVGQYYSALDGHHLLETIQGVLTSLILIFKLGKQVRQDVLQCPESHSAMQGVKGLGCRLPDR